MKAHVCMQESGHYKEKDTAAVPGPTEAKGSPFGFDTRVTVLGRHRTQAGTRPKGSQWSPPGLGLAGQSLP